MAYSGGLDSTVLLHILVQDRRQNAATNFWQARSLSAIHVHHGLQSAADDWAAHCAHQCRHWSVDFRQERVSVDPSSPMGIEAAARDLRYQTFQRCLNTGGVLLTGHHRDDQAETLLQRLMRAGGLRGLAAMPGQRRLGDSVLLLRPMLSIGRAGLEEYARRHQLQWIEDPSNAERQFDRNFIRHELLPLFETRWSAAAQRLADSARHLRSDLSLLDALAAERIQALAQDGRSDVLTLSALAALEPAMRSGLLRHWLATQHCYPSEQALLELERLIIANTNDGQALWQCGELELRLWRDGLYQRMIGAPQGADLAPQDWQPETSIGWGGGVISCQWQPRDQGQPRLKADLLDLQWRPRQGGERCRLPGRSHHHSLKQLLQESSIPPWERPLIPLLMQGESVVAMPGLFIADGAVAADNEPGWALHWRRD